MPNIKSAKKRLRQSIEQRERNRAYRTRIRHTLRKFREAIAANNLDEAKAISLSAKKMLDQTAAKGVIHRNKASRLKSRMSHQIVTHKAAG